MARKKTTKMVVEKTDRSRSFGFGIDQFTIETNKTLLEHKMMTFSTVVARQLGYTDGVMTLTLVWEGKRLSVRFVRDSHPGGGWRSVKEDFVKFCGLVKFKKNQGYSVYQVPGLGQYAFRFEKSWEYFPHGGTVEIPVMRRSEEAVETERPSNPPNSSDVIVWRHPVAAKKTSGASAGMVKKRKPRMRTGGPGKLKKQETKRHMLIQAEGSGKETGKGVGKGGVDVLRVKEEPEMA